MCVCRGRVREEVGKRQQKIGPQSVVLGSGGEEVWEGVVRGQIGQEGSGDGSDR